MDRRVYLHKIIYIDKQSELDVPVSREIDDLGKLCITALARLPCDQNHIKVNSPIFFGSAFSSLKSLHEFDKVCQSDGPLAVNPSLFPNAVLNAPSCRASIYHQITQPIYNISNGVYSGLNAFEAAFMYIKHGESDNAIVCIADETSVIAEKAGQAAGINCCGTVYLSVEESTIELTRFENIKKSNRYKTHILNECIDIIRLINILIDENESQYQLVIGNYGDFETIIEFSRTNNDKQNVRQR